ncbi:unnamed protein product [Bemisia tabaci]|uniref:Neuropathy target esterase sws n=1 Tax=Bemisia tabaci TaxID=7038 RepID=A0A9P0EY91_BEMTA|nr:unnamed protein product [Bemisia tabaci]
MEVLRLYHHLNKGLGHTSSYLLNLFTKLEVDLGKYHNLLVFCIPAILFGMLMGLIVMFVRKYKSKEFLPEVKQFVGIGSGKPRFRKRDRVLFYGRKMLRKMRYLSGQVRGGQGKKRKMVMKFARKLLRMKKDNLPPQLKVLEPPAEFLQEDISSDDKRVPSDAFYMLRSIRIFGTFEKPIFLKLCSRTEILKLSAGSYLFKIGDPDENIYIVQDGKLNVTIQTLDDSTVEFKIVKSGENVFSLLSFTDVLTGRVSKFKSVSARAIEDSTILKLPMATFQEVFKEYPDFLVRVLQIIMVRLQRVTFTALHQYLGLSAELFASSHKRKITLTSPSRPKHLDISVIAEEFPTQENANTASENNRHPQGGSEIMNSSHPVRRHRRVGSYGVEFSLPPDVTESSSPSQNLAAPDIQQSVSTSVTPQPKPHRNVGADFGDEEQMLKKAYEGLIKELGLEDTPQLLEGRVEMRDVSPGTYLMCEDSHKDVAFIYLMSGALVVSQSMYTDPGNDVHLYTVYPGEVVGALAVVTGEPSFFTVRAKHTSCIAFLSKNTVFSLMRERPSVVLHLAHSIVNRLSPFVRQVDFALDWVFLESGRAVYRQGDESDSTYVVLSGRLRSVITHENGKKELVGEYGKGDLIGIVEMVTQNPRSTTVMAVRDSELAKLPEGLFNAMKLRFPIVVSRLINLLGQRILGAWQKPKLALAAPTVDSTLPQGNFSTVALVPASDDVPITAFTYELYHALSAIGSTVRLTSDETKKILGEGIFESSNEYRLTSWLAQQEDQHRVALYQCDYTFTPWTQRCTRQADCILIICLGDKPPSIGKIEKEVEKLAIRTQKELVLLHKEGGEKPNNTVAWLNMRTWVSHHHHLLCKKRMFVRHSVHRINELYNKVLMSEPNIHSDFSRLARWLTGQSVGLILGGGGARGASHVGMVKAIQEAGIPIDLVGGVSIGAFMGGLWCQERDITTMTQKARDWSIKMTNVWRKLLDLTYPATSMFTGCEFNESIRATFGDTQIEDLWLPYFTVTTDISASEMRIHTHGSLWRYVRASMSLSGYLPPLCDPVDGHLLLDGGYVNNLPADIMRSLGAKHVLAIDVGSVDETELTNYGDSLSGWWLLWKRFNPFAAAVKVPNLPDIQSRLAYVSCVRQLEVVKNSSYCEYIRPPIDKYKTLQFGSFDEIKDVGYHHGKTYFAGLMKGGPPPFLKYSEKNLIKRDRSVPQYQNYTFTDLAEMVCSFKTMSYEELSSSTSSEYEDDDHEGGYHSEPAHSVSDMKFPDRGTRSVSSETEEME